MNRPLSTVGRYVPLVLVVIALSAAVAGLLTARTPRTYRSSIELFVNAARPTDTTAAYEGNLFTQQRIASYAEILTSPELAQQVVDELKLPMSADEVAGEITATPVPSTVVLDVAVTDTSPRRAQDIAASVGRQFTDRVTKLETPPGSTTSAVRVSTMQAAGYSATPAGPDMFGNLWRGAAIGLALGLLLALVRSRLDRRLRTEQQIRDVAGVGLLGRTYEDRGLAKKHVVTALNPRSPSVDAFRAMAAGLQHADDGARPRVLLVTGCLPGDGASTVAVNVAVSLARLGNRVLLMDADLRRPRAARYLGLPERPGLAEVLCHAVPLREATRRWGERPLAVLPAGALPPNPGDLLGSDRMRTLLGELRHSYDVVVIDAPPVLPVVDAALMGSLADGCLLVTRCGRIKAEQLTEAVDALGRQGAPLLGVVLSRLPRKAAVAPVGTRGYRGDSAGTSVARGVARNVVAPDVVAPRAAAAREAGLTHAPVGTAEPISAWPANGGSPVS